MRYRLYALPSYTATRKPRDLGIQLTVRQVDRRLHSKPDYLRLGLLHEVLTLKAEIAASYFVLFNAVQCLNA